MHFLQTISVVFGLHLANLGILRRLLGLDDTERFSVRSPEDVIGIAVTAGSGLMKDFDFLTDFIAVLTASTDFPTGCDQLLIDELESRRFLTEIESAGGLLSLLEQELLVFFRLLRRFGLSTSFLKIGQQFRHQGLLLGDLL